MQQFDYGQKTLIAVEFAAAPRMLANVPTGYRVFERLPMAAVEHAFNEKINYFARLIAGRKFHEMLIQRMGYWENHIPVGHTCFVHYARGNEHDIAALYDQFAAQASPFALLGVYHIEPQVSGYPYAFPDGEAPSHWFLGERHAETEHSAFWFNFFPEQPYLFELTFQAWAVFQTQALKAGVEVNQLCYIDNEERLVANGIDKFVQINLCRFTNLDGFFESAHEAGKHSFTEQNDYQWHGMLLKKYKGPASST
jgi:hypothetical protein